jgi:4-oxalocrotonate tautomerase
MPFITVRTLKGALDDAQKRTLQQRLTDVMVEVEGRGSEPFRQFVWVLIEEEEASNWSIGGSQLSLDALKAVTQSS